MKTKNLNKVMKMMVAAILFCGMSINAQAQKNNYYNTKHELGISVGAGQNSDWMSAYGDGWSSIGEAFISSIITGGTMTSYTTWEDKGNIPAISVEYFYHVNKVIGIGAIAGYSGRSADIYEVTQNNVNKTSDKEKVGDSKKQFITVMPAVKIDWLRKKNWGLYSKAAVGATYINEKHNADGKNESTSDNRVRFNFQATLIGCEAGTQNIRGFAELGMGEQGCVLAGIRYKF